MLMCIFSAILFVFVIPWLPFNRRFCFLGYQAEMKRPSGNGGDQSRSTSQPKSSNGMSDVASGSRSSRISSDDGMESSSEMMMVPRTSPMGAMNMPGQDGDSGMQWDRRSTLHPMDAVLLFRRDTDARDWNVEGNLAAIVDDPAKSGYQYPKLAVADIHQWQLMAAEGSKARQPTAQGHVPYRPPSSSQGYAHGRADVPGSPANARQQVNDLHGCERPGQQMVAISEGSLQLVGHCAAGRGPADVLPPHRAHGAVQETGGMSMMQASSSPQPMAKSLPVPLHLEREMKYEERAQAADRFGGDDTGCTGLEMMAKQSHVLELERQDSGSLMEKDKASTCSRPGSSGAQPVGASDPASYRLESAEFIVSESNVPPSRFVVQLSSASLANRGTGSRQSDRPSSQYEALSDEDVWQTGKPAGEKQQQQQ